MSLLATGSAVLVFGWTFLLFVSLFAPAEAALFLIVLVLLEPGVILSLAEGVDLGPLDATGHSWQTRCWWPN